MSPSRDPHLQLNGEFASLGILLSGGGLLIVARNSATGSLPGAIQECRAIFQRDDYPAAGDRFEVNLLANGITKPFRLLAARSMDGSVPPTGAIELWRAWSLAR